MTYTISITDDQVFTALRSWVVGAITVSDCLTGPVNRASMPQGDFVVLTPINRSRLNLNATSYPDGNSEVNTVSFDCTIQVDVYGPNASDNLSILYDSWYGDVTYQALIAQFISPLWIDDPKFIPLVNGEQQYENRWTSTLHLQFKPSITDVQQSALTVTPTIISVDAKYPG